MNILNEDYHVNRLFSGKDVYVNFTKWKTGEINKLLIIGLSGSGKSTLALKIANEYKCAYVQLDRFRGNVYYNDKQFRLENPIMWEYFTNVWSHGDRRNIKIMDPELRREEFEKFIYWVLDRPERIVIEGALEKVLSENEELRKFPIIFKGTSMVTSMARMSWREFHRDHPGKDSMDNLLWWLKWCTKYKKMTDQQNKVRDRIMGTVGEDNYDEIEENALPLLIEAMGYKPQPIIFSDNDVYINYDKWKSGECKSCLITAISGSGKSTLAKKIAERYHAYYVEIDVISFGLLNSQKANWEYIKKNDKYLYKYLQEKNLSPTLMLNFTDSQDKRKGQIIDQYVYWLCFERNDLDKNKIVIAGSDVAASLINIKELSDLPIIIKGTSIVKSIYRKIQRTLDKGHDVWFILDRILNSNYLSMYKYRVPEINDARQVVMDQEYEELEESFLPEITLYHGSPVKVDKIKPFSFSAGNRLRDPSWAVFMLRQYDLALSYAVGNYVKDKCEKNGIKYSFCAWIEKDGFMHYKPIIIADKQNFQKVKDLVRGDTVYIYTLKVPIDDKLNIIGTTDTLPEYVYSGTPKTIKRDDIIISDELLDSLITKQVDEEEFQKIKKSKPHRVNRVGSWADLFIDMNKRKEMRDKVLPKIDSGEIKPGDDLSWLKEETMFNDTTNRFPLTHKQMGEIYTQKAFNESWKPRIPHVSGNITQHIPGAYFNEEVGVWMRKPNTEEQARLDSINESFSGYKFKPLIEAKPVWDPKLWRDPGPNTRDFDIKKELKSFMYPQAIKEKYKGPNLYINLPGLSKDKRFRVRCEMIILDSEGRMLVDRKSTFKRMNLSYVNAGGGIDPGEEIVDAAAREAQEEARITVKDPMDSMLWYAYEVPEDSKRNYGFWGVASFICVGKKKSMYKGYIKVADRDSFLDRSEWIRPEDIKDLLPAHKQAIEMYKNFYLQKSLGINMEFLNNEYI